MCVVAQAAPDQRVRAGSLLPSTRLTGFAPGAGILANGLGVGQMIRIEDFRTAAFCLFAEFVPPAGASRMPDGGELRPPDWNVHGVVTMQPRLAEEIGVLVLIQRDWRSRHWTPVSGRHQTGLGRIPIVANASVPMAELSASSRRGGARR